ncbi:MAG: hypothetical protein Q4C37_08450, partial [Bacteroidales bacterium]|nr:hypothetical protein [Bacteroidales bacterium]
MNIKNKVQNKNCLTYFLFIISISLSLWGILAYDYDILTINCMYYGNWPETAKTLSYSIISGWIIYTITVYVPYINRKSLRQESISEQLKNLNLEISFFFESANIQNDSIEKITILDTDETIIKASSMTRIAYEIPWDKTFPNTNFTYTEQALTIIKKIYIYTNTLLNTGIEYL